jgi:ribosome-associated toxin RatA of RatAB toxin-antitoxin module
MPEIKKTAIVPHTVNEMFELVNAIEDYPQFIPWCRSAEVLSRTEDEIRATLNFARGGLQKSFTTCNRLQKNKMVEIRLLHGPFRHLEGLWSFESLPNDSCQIVLNLEFEFSNRLLAMAFEPFFTQVVNTLVEAFCKRAEEIYGKKE